MSSARPSGNDLSEWTRESIGPLRSHPPYQNITMPLLPEISKDTGYFFIEESKSGAFSCSGATRVPPLPYLGTRCRPWACVALNLAVRSCCFHSFPITPPWQGSAICLACLSAFGLSWWSLGGGVGGTGRGWNGVSNFRLSDGFLRNSQGEREKAAMYVDAGGRWLRNTDRQDADVADLFLFLQK